MSSPASEVNIGLHSSKMRKRRRDNETGSPDSKEPAKRFSKYEVQSLLQQEVAGTLNQSNSKMESLLERVQRLECEPNFDITIRKLEAHIKKVKRRGDAAIAYVRMLGTSGVKVTQSPNLFASGPVDLTETDRGPSFVDLVRCDSDEEIAEHKKTMDGFRQNVMANSTRSMLPDKKKEEERNGKTHSTSPLPPVLSSPPPILCHPPSPPPILSPQFPKAEPKAIPVTSPAPDAPLTPVKTENTIKTEETSPPPISSFPPPPPSPPPCKSDLLSRLPPLPSTPFPSSLPLEAASHSIPQKPVVHLARIQNPTPCLVITWRVIDTDPAPPEMDSYSIYISQESRSGSGVYPAWRNVGVVKALALPMAVTVTKYQSGTTYVTVVGKDRYGRFGPYSDIQTVVLS
ncbi:activating transcription factor 7-interacting protein 2 isoform X1 [Esox lucius]|nr:activating transcription factor 7-interacting protein 2 isoform X1 [Esox lucius]XP_028979537.2 activating transcription factor 7-interacting protein 2 isoform X1 [Esox lucius]